MNQPTINRPRIDPPLIPQVTWVRPLPDFALEIAFNTGEQGRLYLEHQISFTGYFAALAQAEFFKQVYIEHGTLCWPNGIDLDPVVVHAWATNLPIELASSARVYS
jgi:hypothetical protein